MVKGLKLRKGSESRREWLAGSRARVGRFHKMKPLALVVGRFHEK